MTQQNPSGAKSALLESHQKSQGGGQMRGSIASMDPLGIKLKDISNIEMRVDNNADVSLQKDFGGNFLQGIPRLS